MCPTVTCGNLRVTTRYGRLDEKTIGEVIREHWLKMLSLSWILSHSGMDWAQMGCFYFKEK